MPDFKKIVFLLSLYKNDVDLLTDCGYLKDDVDLSCLENKKTMNQQNEDYLGYFKNEEESIDEIILKKQMGNYFARIF